MKRKGKKCCFLSDRRKYLHLRLSGYDVTVVALHTYFLRYYKPLDADTILGRAPSLKCITTCVAAITNLIFVIYVFIICKKSSKSTIFSLHCFPFYVPTAFSIVLLVHYELSYIESSKHSLI